MHFFCFFIFFGVDRRALIAVVAFSTSLVITVELELLETSSANGWRNLVRFLSSAQRRVSLAILLRSSGEERLRRPPQQGPKIRFHILTKFFDYSKTIYNVRNTYCSNIIIERQKNQKKILAPKFCSNFKLTPLLWIQYSLKWLLLKFCQ